MGWVSLLVKVEIMQFSINNAHNELAVGALQELQHILNGQDVFDFRAIDWGATVRIPGA